jgi:type II secretory pathway pseudopilin PulG
MAFRRRLTLSTHPGCMISPQPALSNDPSARRRLAHRLGFSLAELTVVMAIVTVTVLILGQTLAAATRLDPVAEESSIAAEGARTQLEQMRSHPFSELYRLYNDSPADDPGGAGTAPGSHFSIKKLSPPTADGFVGHVIFPTAGGQLREDVSDTGLSMPRDLNGDGLIDARDHAADALILPVRIRVEWAARTGHNGKRSFVLYTMFAPS